jgi:hypothetical protein
LINRLILVGFLSAAALMAQAQDDPPSRVARLNWMSGDVAFQPATVDTWTNATLNYPLTTGDHLYVNQSSRAELHIDGSALRLSANSNFGFLNLNDSIVQMSLNEGSLEIRLRRLDQNDGYEIDTPNGAVTLQRAGEYRVDVDPSRNATWVTVRNGGAQMYQDGASQSISPHQSVYFQDGVAPSVNAENPRDDFDAFVLARDNAEDALPRDGDYVPDTMVGYQDLYAYGHWVDDPLYGWVWVPPVSAGWAPYTTGRWAFVEPWGWTWVDEAPWGFAPFHYGRWVMVRGDWAWVPGARAYRPVYSPALVGFVGGAGFGVSVAWFPLGPHEPWVPAWGASRAYVASVNVMHVTNVNAINVMTINYVNRQSVTVVSQADFASARPVTSVAMRVPAGQIRDAVVIGTAPRVVPERASVVIGAPRAVPAVSAHAVVVRAAPPPAPVSFQARQQMLAQNNGLPLQSAQVAQLRAQQPAGVVARPSVRPIGGAAPRPMDRMSSRPPGAPPSNPAMENRPVQQRPAMQPAQQRTTAPEPAPRQTRQRPAPARQTKAPPRRQEDERR